jgi:hypothetical protein
MKQAVRWPIFFALALFLLTVSLALASTSAPATSKPVARPQAANTPTGTLTTANNVTTTLQATVTPQASSTLTVTVESTVTPLPASTVTPTVTFLLPALNPNDARIPSGRTEFIGPGVSHWYKMSDAGMELKVWVDANGQQGLSLALYAPDQTDLYGKPIGRGAYNKFEPSHDLFWNGYTSASGAGGTWYAIVTNGANIPIGYTLGYKRIINSVKARCSECHGFSIEWDRCEDHGSSWCEDLYEEYK